MKVESDTEYVCVGDLEVGARFILYGIEWLVTDWNTEDLPLPGQVVCVAIDVTNCTDRGSHFCEGNTSPLLPSIWVERLVGHAYDRD